MIATYSASINVVLSVVTGVSRGGADQRTYNYVGNFPGLVNQLAVAPPFVPGPLKRLISYQAGITAPWARSPVKFRV